MGHHQDTAGAIATCRHLLDYIEDRDRFLGEIRCVVCGAQTFKRCHVIMQEQDVVSGKGPCVSFLQVNRKTVHRSQASSGSQK